MLNRDIRPSLYSVELRTVRWQEMVDWYRHTLGLRVLVRVVEDGYALIEAGETRIALLSREGVPDERNTRWSLGFEVHSLQKVAERLKAGNADYDAPHGHEEGFTEITTHDPDGNVIRLFAWPAH